MFMALNFGVLMILNHLIDFMLTGESNKTILAYLNKTHYSLLLPLIIVYQLTYYWRNDLLSILLEIYLTVLMNDIN